MLVRMRSWELILTGWTLVSQPPTNSLLLKQPRLVLENLTNARPVTAHRHHISNQHLRAAQRALSMTGWARGWIPEQILKFRRCARARDLAMIRARGIVLVKAQQVQMVQKIHG